ncbi:MAG: hypothetical protein U5M53_01565 [Rhodoferax sp.]|nr:hypothetical protein [Rhodoferax sp.]
MARLLRTHQPRLFNFAFELRNKNKVKALLNLANPQAYAVCIIKISSNFRLYSPHPAHNMHPTDSNFVIKYLIYASILIKVIRSEREEITQRLFTRQQDLPAGIKRLPLKGLHINHVSMLVPMNTLTLKAAEQWAIDLAASTSPCRQVIGFAT